MQQSKIGGGGGIDKERWTRQKSPQIQRAPRVAPSVGHLFEVDCYRLPQTLDRHQRGQGCVEHDPIRRFIIFALIIVVFALSLLRVVLLRGLLLLHVVLLLRGPLLLRSALLIAPASRRFFFGFSSLPTSGICSPALWAIM